MNGVPVPAAPLRSAAVAWVFLAIGCYTLLAPIDGPVAVGAAVLSRSAATVLAASIVVAAIVAAMSLRGQLRDARLATSRIALGAWFAALCVTAIVGFDPARSFSMIGLALCAAAVHLAIVRWWRAPGVAAAVLWTAVCGLFGLALIALAMQISHHPAAVYATNLGRATGLFVTPNQCAAWLIPFSALAAGVALSARRATARWCAAVAAVTGGLTLLATFSFGGWFGGAAAFVVATWWLGRRALSGTVAALVLALALAAVFLPGLTHHRSSERFVRLDAMRAGLHVAAVFPLLGVGPLAYPVVYPAFRVPSTTEDAVIGEHPHDLMISLLADTGVAGVAAIVFGWWQLGRAILAGYRRADARSRRLVACICAGLIGRFVHGFVDLVGVLELAFVWIPFAAIALAAAREGLG